jgi:hypothetical protein
MYVCVYFVCNDDLNQSQNSFGKLRGSREDALSLSLSLSRHAEERRGNRWTMALLTYAPDTWTLTSLAI